MLLVMQNEKDGRIVNLRSGFDFSTFIGYFFGLAFLPSLFRGDFFLALKLIIAQYLFIVVALMDITNVISINFEIFLMGGFIYFIYICIVNNDRKIKRYKNKGFKAVKLNNI